MTGAVTFVKPFIAYRCDKFQCKTETEVKIPFLSPIYKPSFLRASLFDLYVVQHWSGNGHLPLEGVHVFATKQKPLLCSVGRVAVRDRTENFRLQ